jgi:SNF family Na+-dependent transporter
MTIFLWITAICWMISIITIITIVSTKEYTMTPGDAKFILCLLFWPIGIPIAIIYGLIKLFKIAFKKEN